MELVDLTIDILQTKRHESGKTYYEYIKGSYDPKWDKFEDTVDIVMECLEEASEKLPSETLIEEYNALAFQNDCDEIDFWDEEYPQMDLEVFIDEVYNEIVYVLSKNKNFL